jgi:hypothetical protein
MMQVPHVVLGNSWKISLLSLVRINLPVIEEATVPLLLQGNPKVPEAFEMTKAFLLLVFLNF